MNFRIFYYKTDRAIKKPHVKFKKIFFFKHGFKRDIRVEYDQLDPAGHESGRIFQFGHVCQKL